MIVFRISKEKYANSLSASGFMARWNFNNQFVLYTSSYRSLAALELVAHRYSIKIKSNYKLMLLDLVKIEKDDIFIPKLNTIENKFIEFKNIEKCQKVGSAWYKQNKFLVMKVPSVLIPEEFNFIINTKHPKFKKSVKLKSVKDFIWDKRLI